MDLNQLKMGPKIELKKNYILIELEEVDYWQIWDAIAQVHNLLDSFDKNQIWVFSKEPAALTDVALLKLKDLIKDVYPEDVTMSKMAIVADEGEKSAVASLFSQIAKDLPFEINVFSDFQAAKDWICKA